jgi:cytochrome P450
MTRSSPPAWPWLGHVVPFLRDRLGFLEDAARRYGDVVNLDIGPRTFLLSNASDIQHVLQTYPERYEKGSMRMTEAGRRLAGRGLLTSGGQEHLSRKRILQPLFTHATIAGFGAIITDQAARRAGRWRPGGEIDVEAEMMELVQDVSGHLLLGDDYATDAPGLAEAIRAWRSYLQYWFDYPIPFREQMPVPVVWNHRRARPLIRETLTRHVRKRQEYGGDDLLAMLVRAGMAADPPLTEAEIVDEAQTVALTSFDTVAEAITWTWYLLSQHPEADTLMVDELQQVVGDREVVPDDYQQLTYLRRVVAESMRLYPPSWLFTRVVREDDRLPSGAALPAGVSLFISPWVVQRRDVYFPDPLRFDPDRFSDDAISRRPTFAYLPFGGGRHVCIGQALARLAGALTLAPIATRFRLTLVPGQRIVPHPKMTLRPKYGVRMRVERR